MRSCPLPLVCLLGVFIAGCGSPQFTGGDASVPVDAGQNDGADSGTDAGAADSGTDAGATDSGTDAGAADSGTDAGPDDGGVDAGSLGADAGIDGGCFLSTVGVYGQCLDTSVCAALGSFVSTPGYCPGPASLQCCTPVPSVADNPPVPAGWVLMQQSAVTPDMTAWAVSILHDPTTYPMFSTTIQTFGTLPVMARVEWHPPDFQNNTVHRGVTLYVQ